MPTSLRSYRLSITTPEGQPLFTVRLTCERTAPAGSGPTSAPTDVVSAPPSGLAEGTDPTSRMTEPQKRYLFRLLAQQGVDVGAIEGHLKELFQVTTLREVSKTAASQLIEGLITTQKEVSHAHA